MGALPPQRARVPDQSGVAGLPLDHPAIDPCPADHLHGSRPARRLSRRLKEQVGPIALFRDGCSREADPGWQSLDLDIDLARESVAPDGHDVHAGFSTQSQQGFPDVAVVVGAPGIIGSHQQVEVGVGLPNRQSVEMGGATFPGGGQIVNLEPVDAVLLGFELKEGVAASGVIALVAQKGTVIVRCRHQLWLLLTLGVHGQSLQDHYGVGRQTQPM